MLLYFPSVIQLSNAISDLYPGLGRDKLRLLRYNPIALAHVSFISLQLLHLSSLLCMHTRSLCPSSCVLHSFANSAGKTIRNLGQIENGAKTGKNRATGEGERDVTANDVREVRVMVGACIGFDFPGLMQRFLLFFFSFTDCLRVPLLFLHCFPIFVRIFPAFFSLRFS